VRAARIVTEGIWMIHETATSYSSDIWF